MSLCGSANASGSLDHLPPEIQSHILKQMPDTKTLWSLLRASPRYFQVYRASREAILSCIVCNYITLSVLPIAVDALAQRKQRGPQRDRTAVLAFLEHFQQRSSKSNELYEFSLETSKELLEFHYTVEYFISDFTKSRLALINPSSPNDLATNIESAFVLSKTENSRLSRAFYHLELYGHLFYEPESRQDIFTAAEQSTLFLQHLRDWELEELLCVRSYLVDRLADILNRAEEGFMRNFLEVEPRVTEPAGPGSRLESEDLLFSSMFSNPGGILLELWLQDRLTRGLRAIKAMFATNTPFEILVGGAGYRDNTLSNALCAMPVQNQLPRNERLKTCGHVIECQDDVETPNAGWFLGLAWRYGRHPRCARDYANDSCSESERRFGYVIWDYETLKSFGALTKR